MQEKLFPNLFKVVSNFYFHHYNIQVVAAEDCRFRYFEGDALRDSFLYACSKVKINHEKKEMSLFDLLNNCHYQSAANIIKADCKNKRKSFAIDISNINKQLYKSGEVLNFGLVIIGKLNQHLVAIIEALQLMVKKGIGKDKLKFSLAAFSETNLNGPDTILYQNKKPVVAIMPQHPISLANFKTVGAKEQWIRFNFITPTAFDNNGILTGGYSFRTILQKTISRIIDTAFLFAGTTATQYRAAIAEMDKYLQQTVAPVSKIELSWHQIISPAAKGKTSLILFGHTGYMVYNGMFNFYLDVLLLSQWLQVGDNTTYGFGKIEIQYA